MLYVEDNPANLRFMQDLLEEVPGFRLIAAPTAEQGLALAERHRPALVVMDVNLPGMSGIDAVRRLKSNPDTAAVPVVALSADATRRTIDRGLAAGFSAYLCKPVDVEELIHTIRSLTEGNGVEA